MRNVNNFGEPSSINGATRKREIAQRHFEEAKISVYLSLSSPSYFRWRQLLGEICLDDVPLNCVCINI